MVITPNTYAICFERFCFVLLITPLSIYENFSCLANADGVKVLRVHEVKL